MGRLWGTLYALKPRQPSFVSLLLLLVSCAGLACTGHVESDGAGRGVLFISIDALRADHVGSFGYDRDTTPQLDAFAADAVTFTNAWTASPRDLPAHLALLTGCDPNMARRYRRSENEAPEKARFFVPQLMPHVAIAFLGAGFSTAAFLDNDELAPATGLEAGFQRLAPMGELLPGNGPAGPDVGAEGNGKRLLDWLGGLEHDRDWFAYVHLADLERVWNHRDPAWDGYFRPRPGMDDVPPVSNDVQAFFAQPRSRWLGGAVSLGTYEARYDGRLRSMDARLGALFEGLRRAGRFEGTTICIVGSYGLQFGEHGLVLDHGLFSPADLHVPWIVKPARGRAFEAGRTASALASTLDVAPTLLELAGVERPAGMLGHSQVANFTADVEVREFAFASCGYHEGGAAIGPDAALELTLPSRPLGAEGNNLVRSWFGFELEDEQQRSRVFDTRTGLTRNVSAVAHDSLLDAALEWFVLTEDARRALFGSSWRGDALPPERVAELIELGFLSRRP